MGVYGYYLVRPKGRLSPLAWFRGLADERAAGVVSVRGTPRDVASLVPYVRAFPPEIDFASVVQETSTSAPARDIEALLAHPPGCELLVDVRRCTPCTPWKEVGLRKRKKIQEIEQVSLDLRKGFVFAWLGYADLPSLGGENERDVFDRWAEREGRRHLAGGLERLRRSTLPGLPDRTELPPLTDAERWTAHAPWEEPRPPTWAGHDLLLARPQGGSSESLFPGSGALTLAVASAVDRMHEVVSALLREGDAVATLHVHGIGTVEQLAAAERCWPSPSSVRAPDTRRCPTSAIGCPPAYRGELTFTMEELGLSLTIDATGAVTLELEEKGGLDDDALRALERELGARITFSDAF